MLFSFLYIYVDQLLIISRRSMDTAFILTIESYHVAHKVFLERAIGISRFHQANIFAYSRCRIIYPVISSRGMHLR